MQSSRTVGVEPIRPRYVDLVWACVYTSKTPDQLKYAVKQGHLRMCVARDGSRSFRVDDLDAYMDSENYQLSN